jgi:hypothetical protein
MRPESDFDTAYVAKYGREALRDLRIVLMHFCDDHNIYPDDMGFKNLDGSNRRGAGNFATNDLLCIAEDAEVVRKMRLSLGLAETQSS